MIIAIVSGKGGVTKTTTTVNLSASLALDGYNVLVADTDKQSNSTKTLKAYSQTGYNIADVLVRKLDPRLAIKKSEVKNLDVLPSSYDPMEIAPDEIQLNINASRTNRLKCLEELTEYDFIIIDCPPSLDLITVNVLAVADYVLVPIIADSYGIEGLSHILKKIEIVREELNSKLNLLGIFLARENDDYSNRKVKATMQETFNDKFLKTTIRESKYLPRSTFHMVPLVVRYPSDNASIDYRDLAQELLLKFKR